MLDCVINKYIYSSGTMGMCHGKNALLFCHKDNTASVLNPSPFWIIQVGLLLCALPVKPDDARWFTTEPYKDIVTNYVWSRTELSYEGCTRRNLPYCRRTFLSVHRYNQIYTKLSGYGHDTRKMLSFCVSTYSTCLTRCVIRTLGRSVFQPTVKQHTYLLHGAESFLWS